MARDPVDVALAKAKREKANVEKLQIHLEGARRNYYRAVAEAASAGASKARCGRALGLSEVRVRQILGQSASNGKA
jgi:hypothetical protein